MWHVQTRRNLIAKRAFNDTGPHRHFLSLCFFWKHQNLKPRGASTFVLATLVVLTVVRGRRLMLFYGGLAMCYPSIAGNPRTSGQGQPPPR